MHRRASAVCKVWRPEGMWVRPGEFRCTQTHGDAGRRREEARPRGQGSDTNRAKGRTQDGAERRRTGALLVVVFGSHGSVLSAGLTSDLITGTALRLRNVLSSPLGRQICPRLNYEL